MRYAVPVGYVAVLLLAHLARHLCREFEAGVGSTHASSAAPVQAWRVQCTARLFLVSVSSNRCCCCSLACLAKGEQHTSCVQGRHFVAGCSAVAAASEAFRSFTSTGSPACAVAAVSDQVVVHIGCSQLWATFALTVVPRQADHLG
jgi:hypothetical protein